MREKKRNIQTEVDGFLPKGNISKRYVDDVHDFLSVKEIRNFRIVDINPKKRQYTLSLIDVAQN